MPKNTHDRVKYHEEIRRDVVDPALRQNHAPTYGIIMSYDPENNQATIMTARPGSDQMGEVYKQVPCPQNNGVQSVDPEPGRPCVLSFPNGTQNSPIITAFFNPRYQENDYAKQTRARNEIPRFLTEI